MVKNRMSLIFYAFGTGGILILNYYNYLLTAMSITL